MNPEMNPIYRAAALEQRQQKMLSDTIDIILKSMTNAPGGFSFAKREGDTEKSIRDRVTHILNQTLKNRIVPPDLDPSRLRRELIAHFMSNQSHYEDRIRHRREIIRNMGDRYFSVDELEAFINDSSRRVFPPDVESSYDEETE
jgi:hypothetical protein